MKIGGACRFDFKTTDGSAVDPYIDTHPEIDVPYGSTLTFRTASNDKCVDVITIYLQVGSDVDGSGADYTAGETAEKDSCLVYVPYIFGPVRAIAVTAKFADRFQLIAE